MTVHAVRIKCSTGQADSPDSVPSPEPPDLIDVLPNRISNNALQNLEEKLPEQAQEARIVNTELDGSGTDFIQASRRVSEADSKSKVLDEFENGVVADADWYKVEYHKCDHDEPDEESTGCPGWTKEREKGTVPEGV